VSAFDPELFVYVKIQDAVGPLARGDKYEDALEQLLKDRGLGKITGGGSQLGEDNPDGSPTIAFCGLDIDATDRDAVVALLRERLSILGAPAGTEIHYTSSGAKLQALKVVHFNEEPAVALQILCPVASPGRPLFDHGENRRTCLIRPFEVSIEIVHIDEHAIDNPWHLRPPARLFAHFPVSSRTSVLRGWRRKHDQPVPRFHLSV
jgi:hypothetical protein